MAASLSLSFEKSEFANGVRFSARALTNLRLPLKKPIQNLATALVEAGTDRDELWFVSQSERQTNSDEMKEWRYEEGVLSLEKIHGSPSGSTSDRHILLYHQHAGLRAHLLSPLMIPSALRSSWKGSQHIYAAYVPIGSGIYALRLKPEGAEEGHVKLVRLHGETVHINEKDLDRHWHELNWHGSKSFAINWNVEAHAIHKIRFHLPLLGELEIESRFEE